MAKPKFQIRLPEACHQDWNTMPLQDNGRFCASCSKCVIDFTTKTDKEIIAVFQENNGQVCGTFRNDQLDRLLLPAGNLPTSRWKTFLLAIAALFTAKPEAQASLKPGLKPLFSKTALLPQNLAPEDPVVISGHIRNKNTGKPIANVSITISGTADTLAWTDPQGNFRFELPSAAFAQKPVRILFYHDDFVGLDLGFTPESERTGLMFEFEPVIRDTVSNYIAIPGNLNELQVHQTAGPAILTPTYIPDFPLVIPAASKPVHYKLKKKK
jgi:hypothetical protein